MEVVELVRITARISAVIFAASLGAGAAELLFLSKRALGWKLLGALLVSHTIHFAFVAALTVQTRGQNVLDRGGWILTSVVGVLFYIGTAGALILRRTPPDARSLRNVAGDAACSGVVALFFLLIYVGRIGSTPLFTVLAFLLSGAMLAFAAAVALRIVRRAT